MPYQYKREPLSDDEVNRLTNACESFEEKFVVWTLLDTGLRVSELANLQRRKHPLAGVSACDLRERRTLRQKAKRRILPMTDRVRRFIDHHFAEHDNAGMSVRTI
jgi:integrase/recombinase XerD